MSERGECSKSNSAAVPEADGSVVNVEDLELLTAVKEGNVSFVKTLLEAGAASRRSATVAGVDAVPELDAGSTAMHQAVVKGLQLAAEAGNDEMLDVLLDLHPDVNIQGERGRTPLNAYIESKGASKYIIKKILKEGADPNVRNEYGRTCLHTATFVGNVQMVRYLLNPEIYANFKMLVDINGVTSSRDRDSMTALHIAVQSRREDVILELLNHSPDVNIQAGNSDLTALHLYLSEKTGPEELRIVRKFLELGADLRIVDRINQRNVLHVAVAENKSDAVKCLLDSNLARVNSEKSLDINGVDWNGSTAFNIYWRQLMADAEILKLFIRNGATALHHAAEKGDDGALRKFLQHGASLSITSPQGENCLHIAAARGRTSILKDMLEASNRLGEISFINSIDRYGSTALHHAAKEGYNDAVKVLLDHNADVNVRDNRGMSPLMLYVRNSGATGRLVQMFLERGADYSVLDMKKQNLLHVAAMSSACEVVKALLGSSSLEKVFDVDSVDEDGSTALHLAADRKHNRVLRELLDHDPDVNIRDQKGNTPLIIYCRKGRSLHMVKEFIKHGAKLEILNEKKQGCLHVAAGVVAAGVVGAGVDLPEYSNCLFSTCRVLDGDLEAEDHAEFVSGLVELLVSGGVEGVVGVNAIDVDGMTPLHLAAANGKGGVLRTLLNNEAKVNLQDSRGKTSLHYYLQAGRFSEVATGVVERFFEVGANPSILDENGHNCLHAAVISGEYDRVTCLMEACSKFRCAVDVDAADKQGCTALHLALAATEFYRNILQMVEMLLKYNPSLNIRNKRGETPLHVYRKAGRDSNSEVVEMLRDLGAKDEVDRLGQVDELLQEKYKKDPIFRIRNEVEDDTSVDGQEELSSDENRRRRINQTKITKRFIPFQRQTGAIPLMRRGPQAGTEPRCIPTSSEEEPEEPEDAVDIEDPERTLRSDALALGFQGFDDPFDCARVLFVVVKSGEDVEISFFHHEGMMLFFGLGLRFSKVLLRGSSIDNSIEVQELERTTWMECWSNNQIGSLVVYDREQGIEGFLQDLQSADGGSNYEDSLLSPKNHQLPILNDLQSYLSPFGSMWSSGIRFMIGSNGSSTSETPGTLNNAQPGAGHPGAGLAVQGETTDSVIEDKSGKFELTVIVRLRSQDTDNTKRDPLEINEHEPELKKHFMEPVLTIKFVYEKDGDFILKTFHTTLDLQFHLDTNCRSNTNPKGPKFGWFHNDLEMSFQCSDSDAVSLENPVMLDVESRTVEQVDGTDQSIEAKKGNQGNVKLTVGPRDLGTAQMGITVLNEKAIAVKRTHQQTESRTRSHLPNTTFEVKRRGAPAKLAYSASLADSYDATNREDWEHIRKNGGVETVPFRAEGKWTVDNTAKNPCEYHFTGNRHLYMVVLGKKPLRRPRIITWLPFRKKTIREPEMLMITVTQEIAKTFYIDHSFSCVERLALKYCKSKHSLDWRLGINPTAPADVRDVIDTVDRTSSSSSSTVSTSPATVSSSSSNSNIL